MPINFARQHHVLPYAQDADAVYVAVADPLDPFPLDDLRALLGRPIEARAATRESIDDVINRVYQRKQDASLQEAKDGEDVPFEDNFMMEGAVEVWLNGAKWKDLIATETEEYSGIFRVEVDTAAAAAAAGALYGGQAAQPNGTGRRRPNADATPSPERPY